MKRTFFKIKEKTNLIIFVFILLSTTACIKEKKEIYEKKDYIIAKIDGYDFRSCFKQAVTGEQIPFYKCRFDSLDNLNIYTQNSCSFVLPISSPSIRIIVKNVRNVGDYPINEQNVAFVEYYYNTQLNTYNFKTDSINNGIINISKIDKTNYTISGTFEFTAYCSEFNKYVSVKSGLFNNLTYLIEK